MPGRTTKKLLAVALGLASAGLLVYVLANVVLVSLVPMLHEFRFEVVVLDGDTDEPVRGAVITDRGRELGLTDGAGACRFTQTVRDNNPRWLWPVIGSFGAHSLGLEVSAPGYLPRQIAAGDAIEGVPFRKVETTLWVRVERRADAETGAG